MTDIIGTVGTILRYPVKSLLGERLDQGTITPIGLSGDRTHALIDVSTGKIASAKQPNLWRDLLQYSANTAAASIDVTDAAGNRLHHLDPDFDARLSEWLGRQVKLIDVRPAGIELNRARPDEVLVSGVDAMVTQDVLAISKAAPLRSKKARVSPSRWNRSWATQRSPVLRTHCYRRMLSRAIAYCWPMAPWPCGLSKSRMFPSCSK